VNGIAIGGGSTPGTVIWRTTDGGTNWVPLPTVSGFTAQTVIGFNDKVIISGGEGNIIISPDFGNSWIAVNIYPTSTIYSINIINNNIYACGSDGVFFKSTDMGNTFNMNYMIAANKCLWTKGFYFLNNDTGFAARQFGQILKTTDAGVSWTQLIRDSLSNFINNQAVYFINDNTGFVVGNYNSNVDIIYKTTDGGGSWSRKTNIVYQNLNCISFADANHGAAGGNRSAILYTMDQGINWYVSTVNTSDQLTISGITFYNGLNGIAVGTGIILKTTDGGATWNRINMPSYSASTTLTSVCHFGSTLYTVGGKYCLKSTDAGNTWVNIMDTVYVIKNQFTGLYNIATDKNGCLWVGGNAGLLTTNTSNNLPVELSSFVSIVQGRNILLNWSTQTEKNSDKFNIERETIGTNWETIGSVKASVLSNSPKQYSFTDKNLQSGKFQYRLKMIDNDGTFEYSKVIEAEVAVPKNYELSQNFPNPFNPNTVISYSLPSASNVKLIVFNSLGQTVRVFENGFKNAGNYSVNFNAVELPSGTYYYKIEAGQFSQIKKMILLK